MAITPTGPSKALGSIGIYTWGASPVSIGLPGGKIAVAWQQSIAFPAEGFNDTDGAIFLRMFNDDGTKSGGPRLVNTTTAGIQGQPEITGLKDGGFVVSWVSNAPFGQGHNDTDIHAQIFNSNGTPRGTEIIVTRDAPHTVSGGANSDDDNTQGNVIATKDGGFIATWTDGGPKEGAFAQRFDANGNRVSKEVEITKDGFIFLPGVAELNNGNIVVVNDDLYSVNLWIGGSNIGNTPTGIPGAGKGRYEKTLSQDLGRSDAPQVVALKNGGFALAWKEYPSTSESHMQVETYDSQARLVSSVKIGDVNGADSVRNDFDILSLSNGGFMVSWAVDEGTGSADGIGIRGQAFNGDGTFSGSTVLLNSNTNGLQFAHDMTETADGKVWVSYTDYSAVGTVDLLQGRLFDVTAVPGTPKPVDPVRIDGTARNDTLKGNSKDNVMVGWGGDDTLRGGTGKDKLEGSTGADRLYGDDGDDTLLGGAGNDTLFGGNNVDLLDGGNDNDTLRGGGGGDTLKGQKGVDKLYGEDGSDTLSGGSGNDVLDGGKGGDKLKGDDGEDTLKGGADNDTLAGGNGKDTLKGGTGNDMLSGQGGADRLYGEAGKDTLSGGDFADLLDGGGGNDVLKGDSGDDTLKGADGNDDLTGGKGDDVLSGGKGTDTLSGGEGNDVLDGNSGFDTLTGGGGKDTFVFHANSGRNVITDYNPNKDTLKFDKGLDVSVKDAAKGAYMTWDDGSVLLEGVFMDDIA